MVVDLGETNWFFFIILIISIPVLFFVLIQNFNLNSCPHIPIMQFFINHSVFQTALLEKESGHTIPQQIL